MEEFKIIMNGKNVMPFVNIPPEFKNIPLEISIKPVKSKKLRKELEKILNAYKGEKPFSSIIDPVAWQKEIRNDW
jgi:hypothetical protein